MNFLQNTNTKYKQNEGNRDLKLKGQVPLSTDKNKDVTCIKQ